MLDKRASHYFSNRNKHDPQSAKRRRFYRLMFSIADGIQTMRQALDITQQELASRVATTQSTIARWETPGYTGYTLRKLFEIADQLGYKLQLSFVQKPNTVTNTENARTWVGEYGVVNEMTYISESVDSAMAKRGMHVSPALKKANKVTALNMKGN